VIALAALASASLPAPETIKGGMEVQSLVTCSTSQTICAAYNGSCTTTVINNVQTYYLCPFGTEKQSDYDPTTGTFPCRCAPIEVVNSVLGAACSRSQVSLNYGHRCAQNTYIDTVYRWYNGKTQGDSCSNAYDCAPPRRCLNGVCAAALSVGDVCYNTQQIPYVTRTQDCPYNSFCNITGSLGACAQVLAEGAVCTDDDQCPFFADCILLQDGTNIRRCYPEPSYWIPTGQPSNTSTSSTGFNADCVSGIAEPVTNICLDYDTTYNNFITTRRGATCNDTSSQCGFGSCQCTGGTVPTCQWTKSTPTSLRSSTDATTLRYRTYFNNGCERSPFTWSTSDSGSCKVRSGYWIQPTSFTVCGALHTMTLSSMTVGVIAILSTFFAHFL
jgi:hypothetical protein